MHHRVVKHGVTEYGDHLAGRSGVPGDIPSDTRCSTTSAENKAIGKKFESGASELDELSRADLGRDLRPECARES